MHNRHHNSLQPGNAVTQRACFWPLFSPAFGRFWLITHKVHLDESLVAVGPQMFTQSIAAAASPIAFFMHTFRFHWHARLPVTGQKTPQPGGAPALGVCAWINIASVTSYQLHNTAEVIITTKRQVCGYGYWNFRNPFGGQGEGTYVPDARICSEATRNLWQYNRSDRILAH